VFIRASLSLLLVRPIITEEFNLLIKGLVNALLDVSGLLAGLFADIAGQLGHSHKLSDNPAFVILAIEFPCRATIDFKLGLAVNSDPVQVELMVDALYCVTFRILHIIPFPGGSVKITSVTYVMQVFFATF